MQGSSFVKTINMGISNLYKDKRGFRPYSNLQLSLSTGQYDLDEILNGYVIGGITLLIEDKPSKYHLNLQR